LGQQLSSGIGGLGSQLSSGLSSTQGAIQDLFKNTLGNMDVFQSPLQRQQAQWDVQDARRARNASMGGSGRSAAPTNPMYLANMRR
jgi:hypothetical protein